MTVNTEVFQSRKGGWPRVASILFCFAAIVSLIFGNFLSALAYLVCAVMGWSRPFDENREKGKPTLSDTGRVGVGAAFALIGWFLFSSSDGNATNRLTEQANVTKGDPCGVDGRVTLVDHAVRQDAPLRERADGQAAQVMMAFGTDPQPKPVSIDATMPVREICRAGEWSEVRVLLLPSDIGRARGWVPTSVLRAVKTDENGRRVYEEADFEWPAGTAKHKRAILTVANRVMAQNPKCEAFNDQSILIGKDQDGVTIKAACFGEPEQIVNFRPEDATNERSFAPVEPITKEAARNACQHAATIRASHPSTVDVSIFDATFTPYDDGDATYRTTFTAKNAFNLELNFAIECHFTGSEVTDVEIQETG